jgi:hypothetical protein
MGGTGRYLTLPKAARMCGLTEAELTEAIREGQLKGHEVFPTYPPMIARDELAIFLRQRHNWLGLRRLVRPRVVLLDRDAYLTSIVRIQFRRDNRADLYVVTSSDDLVRFVDAVKPDLVCVCLRAVLRQAGDCVLEALERIRARSLVRLLVYYRTGPGSAPVAARAARDLAPLAPEAILPLDDSIAPLIDRIYELVGVKRAA